MRDSTHLAKDRTEKLSQYVAILLEHKTVQSQQQKADVWINSGNHSFSKTRRQKKKKKIAMHRENFSGIQAQTSQVWPYAVAKAALYSI